MANLQKIETDCSYAFFAWKLTLTVFQSPFLLFVTFDAWETLYLFDTKSEFVIHR